MTGPVVVSFLEVGRGRLSWKATLARLDEGLMIREIRKRGALCSRGIEITDEDGCGGAIYVGGFRCVGKWRVFAEDQAKAAAS